MFRQIRILLLLLILLFVAVGAWLERARSTDWNTPLWVAVYPIAADPNAVTRSYISGLTNETFEPISSFMQRESQRYGIALEEPVRVLLYGEVASQPPRLERDAEFLGRAVWSLRLRFWAWRAADDDGRPPPDVRMFVMYHDPGLTQVVPHSLGLQKGLLGVVHAFADASMTATNNIVIAHEFLHTLGATDKYDGANRPIFPHGYADPQQTPLYPQRRAEVMAGRRMLTETSMDMPESLGAEVIGSQTALEIGWKR